MGVHLHIQLRITSGVSSTPERNAGLTNPKHQHHKPHLPASKAQGSYGCWLKSSFFFFYYCFVCLREGLVAWLACNSLSFCLHLRRTRTEVCVTSTPCCPFSFWSDCCSHELVACLVTHWRLQRKGLRGEHGKPEWEKKNHSLGWSAWSTGKKLRKAPSHTTHTCICTITHPRAREEAIIVAKNNDWELA